MKHMVQRTRTKQAFYRYIHAIMFIINIGNDIIKHEKIKNNKLRRNKLIKKMMMRRG